MGKFTHYLVTRFNVKADGLGPEHITPATRTADWEHTRMPLFQQYCVPSVAGQSSMNFTWLLFCDHLTPPSIITDIEASIGDRIPYQLHHVADFADMLKSLQAICQFTATPYVITSRLDNDDGIGTDYIRTVQSHFRPQRHTIINLLGGVHYQRDNGIFTYLRYSLNNSFISLIEETGSTDAIQTVYGFRHLTPGHDKITINVKERYAFWMTLHGQNAARRVNLGWPVSPGPVLKHYNIDSSYVTVSLINTLRYFMRWFPKAVSRKMAFLIRHNWRKLRKRSSSSLQHTAP